MSTSTYISFYLRSNKIHIFSAALREIGTPRYIRFLVHAEKLQLVMQAYHKKEFISFRVPKEGIFTYGSMEVASKAFCQLVAVRLGWDITKSYRIPGIVYPAQKIVVFDLTKSIEI